MRGIKDSDNNGVIVFMRVLKFFSRKQEQLGHNVVHENSEVKREACKPTKEQFIDLYKNDVWFSERSVIWQYVCDDPPYYYATFELKTLMVIGTDCTRS